MTKRLKLMKDGVKTNKNQFKNLQKTKQKQKPCFQFLNCLLWELKGAVTKRGFLKMSRGPMQNTNNNILASLEFTMTTILHTVDYVLRTDSWNWNFLVKH